MDHPNTAHFPGDTPVRPSRRWALLAASILLISSALAETVRAGSTGTSELYTIQGGANPSFQGDDITTNGLSYFFYAEVPPGLSSWTLELFDADIGISGVAEEAVNRDADRGGTYNTTCTYTLRTPGGSATTLLTAAPGTNACPSGGTLDNAWCPFVQSPATAGHWELEIDCPTGNDSNAIGIRAHDGTAGSGGTEIPVYYDSYTNYGKNDSAADRSYTSYPWVTRNCSALLNDFDADDDGTFGNTDGIDFTLTSRLGTFSSSFAGSGNDIWQNTSLASWVDDDTADDYGIWSLTANTRDRFGSGDDRNYVTCSVTDADAGGPGPGSGVGLSQPDANAFRVYLSTDAIDDAMGSNTAPAKPYMRQYLAHSSGPNPAVAGMTSTYAITIGITNPTAHSITFSASNTIRSLVPTPAGGTVTYQGIVSSTPGSITVVSQPAIGGTGFVEWHPGALAAGTSASIAYRVDVTPAAAPPASIPATGIPGDTFMAMEAGTLGTYVDETGNTTQARATYTFGPICELSASTVTATYALVSSFEAFEEGDRLVVEWETATEAGTLGFDLERLGPDGERIRVNTAPIPALAGAPQGARYRFVDDTAPVGRTLRYELVERGARGEAQRFGPFEVEPQRRPIDRGPRAKASETYTAEARQAPAELLPQARSRPGPPIASGSPNRGRNVYKLSVGETGVYRVDLRQLPGGGLTGQGVSLQYQGRDVAFAKGANPHKIYFYAQEIDSLYTEENAYWLSRGRPTRIGIQRARPRGTPDPSASFPAVERFELDVFPATTVATDPESDYWFWKSLAAGTSIASQSFALEVADPAPGQTATLEVELFAATTLELPGEHRVEVLLNGGTLGETTWQGLGDHVASFHVPAGLLLAGANTVELRSLGAAGSVAYTEGFDLGYARLFRAVGDELTITGAAAGTIEVTGFSQGDVMALDVTDPEAPRFLTQTVSGGGPGDHSLRFEASPGAVYHVFTAAAIRGPVATATRAELPNFGLGAEYLVIAPEALFAAAERLAGYRSDRGLSARAVSLEAVYDAYADGLADPRAIRDFLTEASAWPVAARWVVLAGEGSVDYRDLLGHGGQLVPPLMAATDDGLFSSDLGFGDTDGDGQAEIAIGRVPAVSTAELDAFIDKLIAYESQAAHAGDRFLFLADNPDKGGDFNAVGDGLERTVDPYELVRVELEGQTPAAARAALFDQLEAGSTTWVYSGHGGIDRLGEEGFLTTGDLPAIAGLDTLPVTTALTCTIGRFEVPGFPSLAEELVRSPGGAIAVWAPSGLAFNPRSALLGERFVDSIYRGGERNLGEAVLEALRQTAPLGDGGPVIYNLFGDPALELQVPEPPSSGPVPPPHEG